MESTENAEVAENKNSKANKVYVKFPLMKWLTGGSIDRCRNKYVGSYGTDPLHGCTGITTLSYSIELIMHPQPPKDSNLPKAPTDYPRELEVCYWLQYPLGHTPAVSSPVVKVLPYEAAGFKPPALNDAFLTEGQDWLNDEIARLIAEGVINETVIPSV